MNIMKYTYVVSHYHRFPDQSIKKIYFWSDNCCSQFKNNVGFLLRSIISDELGVTVEQHMGAPGHGKGSWDGESGIAKCACAREVLASKNELSTAEVGTTLIK
jgi:hypothetical protein